MAIDKNSNEYLEVLQELLRQAEERNRRTLKAIGEWVMVLLYDYSEVFSRDFVVKHIEKIYKATALKDEDRGDK